MAGGGFRFGCYLGMHAAAEEVGLAPDVLIGACGGAIAAAVVQALPDAGARFEWLTSPQVHVFQQAIATTSHASLLRVLPGMMMRAVRPRHFPPAKYSSSTFLHQAMFELPALPILPPAIGAGPDVAIIGARVSFPSMEVQALERGNNQWPYRLHETVFGPPRVAQLLAGRKAWAASDPDASIDPLLECNSTMGLLEAVRVSIADPYYFPCVEGDGGKWSGGLVDLFPIEIAQALAKKVVMERKREFNALYAQPAVRAVYGVDGNARRKVAHAQHADVWIDTTDASRQLRNASAGKRIDFSTARIAVNPASDHQTFVKQIKAQWQYGRERALRGFDSAAAKNQ